MINYTTPTISLTVEGVDLTGQEIYVSMEQGSVELTKTDADLTVSYADDNTEISFTLSQTESAMFRINRSVEIQVNWISESGVRAATQIATIPVMRNLLAEVVEYGN